VGRAERAAKWAGRQPLAAELLAMVFLNTLGGLTGVSLAWRRATRTPNASRPVVSLRSTTG
jgi:hypothetical protein